MLDPDPGNNANFFAIPVPGWPPPPPPSTTIGAPYYRTEAGEFENSVSPYGTFDQNGNVFEWLDTVVSGSDRSLQGGDWYGTPEALLFHSGLNINPYGPSWRSSNFGFRVASIPEPSTLALLPAAVIGLAACAWRRRKGMV
jgi:hypothetical protein